MSALGMAMVARYETLAKWVNEFGWTRGAELGVSDGRTFIYLLENCPQLQLIGVDTWDIKGTVPGPTASNEVCSCEYCLETRAAKKNMPIEKREAAARKGIEPFAYRASFYKMDTGEAAKEIADGSLDFVFVDGDHSADGVYADLVAWTSKIKPGGRLVGHDWHMRSVQRGVSKYCQGGFYWEDVIAFEDDHVWWVDL